MTKFSKKLVSKCIYIEILKCSETDLLCQFMQAGGWTLVHLWLTDAIASQNWSLVHEILELLLLCPVDVERLKSNTAPKLVKQLTKDEHPPQVKLLAETLVQQWLRIVRGEAQPSGNTSTSDGTSDNEDASQDVPETLLKEEEEVVEETPVQEKIVLKLSVKDGKNVIIKKSESTPKEVKTEVVVETELENLKESEEKESVTTSETKTEEGTTEKKQEKEKKKSSSSKSSSKSLHKSGSSSSSSSSSKHKSSSNSSSKDKDKDRHKSSSHKSSSSKSSSSKSSSRSDKEKKKDKEPEMSEADKVAKTLAELQPEKLTKLGKIPKKPRENDDKKQTKPVPASPTVPKVKPTFSIEERDPEKRSKTVKTLNSKFRSHGLEEEAPPPPSRNKTVKKPTTTTNPLPPPVLTTGIKRVSPPRTTIGKDPALSPPAEKKPKLQEENRPNGLIKMSKPKSRKLTFKNISNKISSLFLYRQRERERTKDTDLYSFVLFFLAKA